MKVSITSLVQKCSERPIKGALPHFSQYNWTGDKKS